MPPQIYWIPWGIPSSWCCCLFPAKFVVYLVFGFFVFKLLEIKIREQIVFDVVNSLIQCIDKLEEVLFVQKDFVFFLAKIFTIHATLTFCDGQVVIASSGRLDVKKIGALSGFYFFRENFFSIVSSVIFQGSDGFGVGLF